MTSDFILASLRLLRVTIVPWSPAATNVGLALF